jgi:hypothetical protein
MRIEDSLQLVTRTEVQSLKKNPDVYFFVDIAGRGVNIRVGTGADSDISRSLCRYTILYHDLNDDFVHKLCSYICMLLYSNTQSERWFLIITTTSTPSME